MTSLICFVTWHNEIWTQMKENSPLHYQSDEIFMIGRKDPTISWKDKSKSSSVPNQLCEPVNKSQRLLFIWANSEIICIMDDKNCSFHLEFSHGIYLTNTNKRFAIKSQNLGKLQLRKAYCWWKFLHFTKFLYILSH